MRFWDSSALVPLLCEERASRKCRAVLREDSSVAVWILTRLEIVSAIRRKQRESEPSLVLPGLARLEHLAERWVEIDAVTTVRDRAERLLATHVLSTAGGTPPLVPFSSRSP